MTDYYDDGRTRDPLDHAHEARACLPADIFKVTDEIPEDFLRDVTAYLSDFAAPIRDEERAEKPMLCLHCGEPLNGMMASLLGRGGFEWGIAHGEGHCRGCGWPARAHHFAKDLFTLHNFVLQYLPDYEAEGASRVKAVSNG